MTDVTVLKIDCTLHFSFLAFRCLNCNVTRGLADSHQINLPLAQIPISKCLKFIKTAPRVCSYFNSRSGSLYAALVPYWPPKQVRKHIIHLGSTSVAPAGVHLIQLVNTHSG